MSTPFTPGADVGGFGAAAGAGGVGVGGVGNMLPVTGMGPGTALLAVAGVVSLVVGAIAAITGKRFGFRNDLESPLRDLSHLARMKT